MIIEDLYNLGRGSFSYIAKRANSVIEFFSRSIKDILMENIEEFDGGILDEFIVWLTEKILNKFPILDEISLFTFVLGGGIAFYTIINMLRLFKDLSF